MYQLDPEEAATLRLPLSVPIVVSSKLLNPNITADRDDFAKGIRTLLAKQPKHPDADSYRKFLQKYDRNLWEKAEEAYKRSDWRAAARALELMVAIDPEDARAYCDLGTFQQRVGKAALAEASFRRAIALAPALALAQTRLGSLLLDLERYEEAAGILEHSVKVKEDQFAAHFYLGQAAGHLDDHARARDALLRAVELAPGDPRPLYFLAVAYAALNEPDLAVQTLNRLLEIEPEQPEALSLRDTLYESVAGSHQHPVE
jgi:tetratricopeptide (TPR) repeat protein